MRFVKPALVLLVSRAVALPAVADIPVPYRLEKRASVTTSYASDLWVTSGSSTTSIITPYALDGVTVNASPVTASATPWVSLDSSGIPYKVTPTVSKGSTVSTSPTPTNTNYPTPAAAPPVLRCMNERVPSETNPLCIADSAEFVVGETYWITWNPLYWNSTDATSVNKVKIKLRAYPGSDSETYLDTSDWVSNSNGFYAWTFESSHINIDNDGKVQIVLAPLVTENTNAENEDAYSGPVVRVIASKGDGSTTISRVPSDNGDPSTSSVTTSSSGSSNKIKTIVPAVVVPVVVIILVAAIVFTFLWRKRNNAIESYKMNVFSKGYVGSRKERMGKSSESDAVSDKHSQGADTANAAHESPFADRETKS